MLDLKAFEIEALRRLTDGILPPGVLDAAIRDGEFVSFDYSGSGYFLTFRHPALPEERIVCDTPEVVGESNGVEGCFVVFLEKNELTIDCYFCGEKIVPEAYRTQPVTIRSVKLDSN